MELISGLHRLEAFRARGREEILACLIDVTDLQAAMVEIDEKLMRTEPIAFQRSEAELSTEPRHADEVLAPLRAPRRGFTFIGKTATVASSRGKEQRGPGAT
ncbi:hypothetical protein [Sorangium sp. So ce381]|uniref:hypothetical protein n=1 Tax=Sorangium sp. So ce381 TaxID=3133307 RepID=UPI003F5C3712